MTSFTTASLRRGIGAFNVVGRALRRAGVPVVSFDPDSIVDEARRSTRLDDFGGEAFRAPLEILLRGYDSEANLSPIGRLTARRDTVSLLANRLRLVDDRRRHPAIAAEEIRRPIFIVGLPRTGSTLLHHLLAQDVASRVPRTWEVMFPSPPPDGNPRDPRIRQADARLWWLHVLAPEFRAIHPLGAELALECIAIMAHTFLSSRFHTTYHVPTYQAWLEQQDLGPAYDFHHRFLQHLQWRSPARRWVLKAPAHLFGLEPLFQTYPDAMVIHTHREPLTVLASVASLTAVLQRAFAEHVDPAEIGQEVSRRWANGLERAIEARLSNRIPAERVIDVYYHELVADPMATIRRVYARFDLPLSTESEQRMRRHLGSNPKDKHGPHQYSLKTFGLDPDELGYRFKAYREHFGIRPEPAADSSHL